MGSMVGDSGWRRGGWIALFILPGLAGMLLFVIGPILASGVLTFYEWDLLTDPKFIGFDNFRQLRDDEEVWQALRHTLYFIAGYVPAVRGRGPFFSTALNTAVKGRSALPTALFP